MHGGILLIVSLNWIVLVVLTGGLKLAMELKGRGDGECVLKNEAKGSKLIQGTLLGIAEGNLV